MADVRSCESADVEENISITSELKTALRTQPVSFVLRFISQNGLEQLLSFLTEMNNVVRYNKAGLFTMQMYACAHVEA